jgi:hypothetical protein
LKNNDLLLLGLVGLVGVSILAKARAAASLIFLPGGVNNIGFEGSTPTMDFTVLVQNTSSSGFWLNSLAGQITCDNTYVGNISSFSPVYISGNSQTVISLRARLAVIGLVNQLMQAFINKDFQKDIVVNGYANAGIARAPINMKFTIGA